MRFPKHDDPIEFLVNRKFSPAPTGRGLFGNAPAGELSLEYLEKQYQHLEMREAYRADLTKLPESQLAIVIAEEKKRERADLQAKAESEESKCFFNLPHAKADYAHWSKAAYWTLDEAVALSFGKAPEKVKWETVKSHVQVSPFARNYERLRDLAQRAKAFGQLYDQVLPGFFIAWAKRNDIQIDPELESAVAARGPIADWKSAYDRVQKELGKATRSLQQRDERILAFEKEREKALNAVAAATSQIEIVVNSNSQFKLANDELAVAATELIEERGALKGTINQLQTELNAAKSDDKALKRDSLLKLVIGMATGGYAYDPSQKKSDKIADIVSDLDRSGVSLDADTVRKWLKKAAELLPGDKTE